MIKALAQTQKWQDALHSLDWPFDSNDVAKKTTVLSACGRTSQWSLLCLLADPKKQSQDKLVLSNVAINSFDRNSLWQRSCDVFASFALAALKPDKISFQSTLSSYSRGRQWTLALDLHDTYHSRFTGANSHGRVSVHSMQSASSYNMVTKACAQGGEWRNAVAILQEFLLSRLSLACEQRKRHETNREQNSTAKHGQLSQPTTADQERTASVFITSATSGCEKAAWQLVLNSVLSSSRADAVMLTSSIKIAPWHVSQQIFAGMTVSGLFPDIFALTALIGSHESREVSLWEQALQHLAFSTSLKLALDVATYNVAMNACAVYKEWLCVLQLLQSMRASKLQADSTSYKTLAVVWHGRGWELGLSALAKMSVHGVPLDKSLDFLKSESMTWTFALQILTERSANYAPWRMHCWQMAFYGLTTSESQAVPDKVLSEACDQLGWEWTVSALSSGGSANQSVESLASAFTIAHMWEAAFTCIRQLVWQPSQSLSIYFSLFFIPAFLRFFVRCWCFFPNLRIGFCVLEFSGTLNS